MYTVYQHWDPLKVCMVGKSYPPEFYSFIANSRVRNVLEKIAYETEEDYQKLIKLLESFGVEVLRPDIPSNDYRDYLTIDGRIVPPPMCPRDYSAMIGSNFYIDESAYYNLNEKWHSWRGSDWPVNPPKNKKEFDLLEDFIKKEIIGLNPNFAWDSVINKISDTNPVIVGEHINTAMTTRIGRDLYFGTNEYLSLEDIQPLRSNYSSMFPDYRCHVVNTGGHNESTFCPLVPGIIVSLLDISTYADTFPGWEVLYLPNQSWAKVNQFLTLKEKNKGKWWVPGEELNDQFTNFVEVWLNHWVGYVEETVFDVNMLVIDEKNVVCNNYNEKVFNALKRYNVTPHVINFRHRYFWDGGLHCITSDLHREGIRKDYFPERG